MVAYEYKGNCHCGAFRFNISLAEPIASALLCNCSICSKKGYVWNLGPLVDFKVTHGKENELGVYEFGERKIRHMFCIICGSAIMKRIDSNNDDTRLSINLRIVEGVDTWALQVQRFDGWKTLAPEYVAHQFTGEMPSAKDGSQRIYTGSCHCGDVRVALKSLPLDRIEVKEDNCSICRRNANICVYPTDSNIAITGVENTTEYLFGRKFTGHRFCKTCGVPVYMKIYGPPKHIWERLPYDTQERLRPNLALVPLRVAILDNVDISSLSVERNDEGTTGYVLN
ncbi:Mss4-like protein [Acrodontium crateriforme]|uniref:Mss4-like protein n=1 Tax=Acrodontium crateriforme TaxID=150365 RepID=A0AAQ3R344_9PEZI|nr:Mss4-like protein [Acrodontium crateriforme]